MAGDSLLVRTGLWRVTRNPYGRRLYEALHRLGVTGTSMVVYRAPTLDTRVSHPEVTLRVAEESPPPLPDDVDRTEVQPGDDVLVAERDGAVVGSMFVAYGRARSEPLEATVRVPGGYLWRLYVEPDHRGEGIATGLVQYARGVAGDRDGADVVDALVAVDNVPSRRAFEGNGFTAVGTLDYYRVGPWTYRRGPA